MDGGADDFCDAEEVGRSKAVGFSGAGGPSDGRNPLIVSLGCDAMPHEYSAASLPCECRSKNRILHAILKRLNLNLRVWHEVLGTN